MFILGNISCLSVYLFYTDIHVALLLWQLSDKQYIRVALIALLKQTMATILLIFLNQGNLSNVDLIYFSLFLCTKSHG